MNKALEILSPISYLQTSNWLFHETKNGKWTHEENKCFENALALHDKDAPDRWFKVAAMIPGKTVGDVIKQYRELEEDVSDIEAGLIPIPGYGCDHERKKGVPWTEEEHRQFLMGLKKYGKGDWRNISRNFMTTRTPTQVASHAQKYFIRQLTGGKDKRRSSIHDITTVNLSDTVSSSSDHSKSLSPNDSSATMQTREQPRTAGVTKEVFDFEWKQRNEGAAIVFDQTISDDAFFTPCRGISSYLEEQDFIRGTLPGSYISLLQMQSMQRP